MRRILSILTLLLFLWAIGLVAYVHQIPQRGETRAQKTDAIVVLTGGSLRIAYGFELFAKGLSGTLIISGVDKKVTLDTLLQQYASPATRSALRKKANHILLDRRADSTQQNAREVALFVRQKQFRSIRLITANYHMPRSVLEVKRLLPGVTVIPDAVFPSAFRRDAWWKDALTRSLLLSEFHKYWWARVRPLIAAVSE